MLQAALGFALAAALTAAQLTPRERAAIAPVLEAAERARAEEAASPPPKTSIEKIIRLGKLDQAPRLALSKVNFNGLSPEEHTRARKVMGAVIDEIDQANQQLLLPLIPQGGWITRAEYGENASRAAFHIIQHSNLELWRRFLPILEPLVASGEIRGQDYALMYDRLAMNEGRPQRFGSQFRCINGKNQLHPLEDAARVDQLRRSMGMGPLAEYVRAFESMNFPC
ncbi:DUF6624 domain-containing protein [Phenylobacterium deserti]|uniref:Uncharacterized protein n=1 Tax=Phenylobacterium deserti TaxID=1914756 RepID=A0A328ATP8_9CAUL|nr:DUF6624 domain-containing protein [Phenylobacterium deserti]RAK57601.1 hypothetical protein DJ018_06645 [Phenylobacterium deserti]